jgi:O-antigen ligase
MEFRKLGLTQVLISVRWLWVAGLVFVTRIDYGRVGLTNPDAVDTKKWIVLLPFWYLPLAFIIPRWSLLLNVFRRPPISWLLAWCALGAMSVLWAVDGKQAILVGLAVTTLALVPTWQVFDRGWHSFATAVVAGLTVNILLGVLWDLQDGILFARRPGGLTTGATTVARLGMLNVVLAAGLIWSKRGNWLLWPAAGLGVFVLVLSETRTAIFATIVGLAYGGLRRLSRQNRNLLISVAMVGGVALLVLSASFLEVGEQIERGDPTSISGRTDIWPVAVGQILNRPILGHGMGSEEAVFIQAALDGELDFLAGTTHSMYLSVWLSGGIIGFILLFTALVSAWRRRRNVDPWVVAPLLTVMITGLTEAIVHVPTAGFMVMSGSIAAIAAADTNGRVLNGRSSVFGQALPVATNGGKDRYPIGS